MNQDIRSLHLRALVAGFAPNAVTFRYRIGKIGCVILLGLTGLRFYFIRELLAALALVTVICVPVFVVFLILILLRAICQNLFANSPNGKSTVITFFQSCRVGLHATTIKIVAGLYAAASIASAKITFNRPGP